MKAILFALLLPLVTLCPCAAQEPTPVKWEYMYYYAGENGAEPRFRDIMKKINELGEQGWELIRAPSMEGILNTGVYIFKRPKRN